MNADPTLLQMKFARIVAKLSTAAGIPVREALDFFYRSQFYPLLRDGVADLHCMSDEYLVEDLLREYRSRQSVHPLDSGLTGPCVAEAPAKYDAEDKATSSPSGAPTTP